MCRKSGRSRVLTSKGKVQKRKFNKKEPKQITATKGKATAQRCKISKIKIPLLVNSESITHFLKIKYNPEVLFFLNKELSLAEPATDELEKIDFFLVKFSCFCIK